MFLRCYILLYSCSNLCNWFFERGCGGNEEEKEKISTVVLYLSSVAVLWYSRNVSRRVH